MSDKLWPWLLILMIGICAFYIAYALQVSGWIA